jgi:uncharacterized protein YfeS
MVVAMTSDEHDHDPWNNPEDRHPRAHELMAPELWDCVNEDAPFGSDEGADAYSELRAWREQHPKAPLVDCIAWIGDGRLAGYSLAAARRRRVATAARR